MSPWPLENCCVMALITSGCCFDGRRFDETKDVGAGPFHAEYRARPLLW